MKRYMRKLGGIDDPAVERLIYRRLTKHPRLRRCHWSMVLLSMFSGVLLFKLRKQMLMPRYALLAILPIVAIVMNEFLLWLWRRLIAETLKEVLSGLNRCTGCGYQLAEDVVESCPECGRANGTAA